MYGRGRDEGHLLTAMLVWYCGSDMAGDVDGVALQGFIKLVELWRLGRESFHTILGANMEEYRSALHLETEEVRRK